MTKMRLLASLLALLLLLCMAHPCVGASDRETIVVFKGGQTEVPYKENDDTVSQRQPLAFRVPAFVGGMFKDKELFVLLCDARYTVDGDSSFIEPAAKTSYDNYKTWSAAEIIAKNTRKSTKSSVLGAVTAVMKDDKIYVLTPRWDELDTLWYFQSQNTGWDTLMIVGTVTNLPESAGGGVQVKWDKGTSLKTLLPKTVLGAQGLQFIGGLGNGIVTKSGAIVFPIQIANNKREYTSSILYSTDNGSTWKMGGTTEQGTSEGSVTEWGNGKLLLSVQYDRGVRKAYESDDMGATWKESTMFSGVWGNQPSRSLMGGQGSLITVPVEGKDVLLFSHPLNKKGGFTRDTLQLWMSDGQRIKYVGTISEDGKGEFSGNSILAHVGHRLYSVHEINPYEEKKSKNAANKEWDGVIALSTLPDLFDSVKSTVRAWQQVDAEIKNKSFPTNGIVGFLADSKKDTVWEDKYNSVHATVKGGTRVEGGFRFNGKEGSVAKWPVKIQGQNQFYTFAQKQFTLAATVTIDSAAGCGYHLLLGASKDAKGDSLIIGLGRTRGNTWYVVDEGGSTMSTGVPLEIGKEYQVAIKFNGKTVSVYVDGVSIIKGKQPTYEQPSIDHFFMGSIGISSFNDGCETTVKNVMLFNRVVDQTEFSEIKTVDKKDGSKTGTSTTKNPKAGTDDREGDFNGHPDYPYNGGSRKGESADGAVQSVSFAALMCIVYSAIVLAVL